MSRATVVQTPTVALVVLTALLGGLAVGVVAADGPVVEARTTFQANESGPTVEITEELELEYLSGSR